MVLNAVSKRLRVFLSKFSLSIFGSRSITGGFALHLWAALSARLKSSKCFAFHFISTVIIRREKGCYFVSVENSLIPIARTWARFEFRKFHPQKRWFSMTQFSHLISLHRSCLVSDLRQFSVLIINFAEKSFFFLSISSPQELGGCW